MMANSSYQHHSSVKPATRLSTVFVSQQPLMIHFVEILEKLVHRDISAELMMLLLLTPLLN